MRRRSLKLKNRSAAVVLFLLGGAGCGSDQRVASAPLWSVERLSSRPGEASEAVGAVKEGVVVVYGGPPDAAPPREYVLVRRGPDVPLGEDVARLAVTAEGDVMADEVRAQLRLGRFGEAGTATGINAHGEVIGCGRSGAARRGYLWREGTLTRIPPVAGQDHTCAHQIDQHGVVLAETYSLDPAMLDSTTGHRWFLWTNGAITLLGSDDADSRPLLRNGRVLMNRWEGGPTIWENGHVVELSPGDDAMTAVAMNEDGVVVGYWTDRAEGFVWDRAQTNRFALPNGVVTWMDVDESKRVLITMGSTGSSKAFVLADRGLEALPGLGGADSHSAAFSAKGSIVGWSTDRAGVRHAVRWHRSKGERPNPREGAGELGGPVSERDSA